MLQESEIGHFRPLLLATRYTPNRGLSGLSRQSLEGEFSEVRQKGSNITHLHDASEPLLLSTFLLSATAIGRRGGHTMEQRAVVLYARSRSLRCWRAKRLLSRGGQSTIFSSPKEGDGDEKDRCTTSFDGSSDALGLRGCAGLAL